MERLTVEKLRDDLNALMDDGMPPSAEVVVDLGSGGINPFGEYQREMKSVQYRIEGYSCVMGLLNSHPVESSLIDYPYRKKLSLMCHEENICDPFEEVQQ